METNQNGKTQQKLRLGKNKNKKGKGKKYIYFFFTRLRGATISIPSAIPFDLILSCLYS